MSMQNAKADKSNKQGGLVNTRITIMQTLTDIFTGKLLTSVAHVNQACIGRMPTFLLLFVDPLSHVNHVLSTIVQIRPVHMDDGRLGAYQDQCTSVNPILANARPDLSPPIVSLIPIEVTTMPILSTWCRRHGDGNVDISTLASLIPTIDLHRYTIGQLHVDNTHLLTLPSLLQHSALIIVLDPHLPIGRSELRREALQDRLAVVECVFCTDDKHFIIQEWAAHCNFFGDSEALGHRGCRIPCLNVDWLALHKPVLTGGVIIRMLAIESDHVWVTKDHAFAWRTYWRRFRCSCRCDARGRCQQEE